MNLNHRFQKIALVPYWLKVTPQELEHSDHSWWFRPLAHYETILYVGPYLNNNIQNISGQSTITIKTSSLVWSIHDIKDLIDEKFNIKLENISILWHVIEASSTCRVKDLAELRCPLVAVIADTHHLKHPISSLVPYLRDSKYTHITCTHNQHAPFFSNACNIPSFSFPYTNLGHYVHEKERSPNREVIYYGNLVSSNHIFRTKVVNTALTNSSLQLGGRLSFPKWLEKLAESNQNILTCSLNGSFSFQTLMPLMYGNSIITDPICSANWLGSIVSNLPECHIYYNMAECLDILQNFEKGNIKPNMQKYSITAKILQSCLADQHSLRQAFTANELQPQFLPNNSTNCDRQLDRLLSLTKKEFGFLEIDRIIYSFEHIQELHRLTWDLGIAPIKIICNKTALIDAFLRLLPQILPRLRYPDSSGISVIE